MKDLRPVKGSFYIARLIAEGEHEHQDFKYAISDARKIARSISAFANNDGGRLLIGVKDNGVVAGVRNEEDIYVIEEAAQIYCSPAVMPEFTAFRVDGGLIVIRAEIAPAGATRPVAVSEADGSQRFYYRVADENIAAPDLMVRSWQATAGDRIFRLTDTGRAALDLLERHSYLTPELLAVNAAISQATAEDLLIDLHAMGLLRWDYRGGSFRLIALEKS